MKLRHDLGIYRSISVIAEFLNEGGFDSPSETIEASYKREARDPKAYCE